jgi:hypothetical protein
LYGYFEASSEDQCIPNIAFSTRIKQRKRKRKKALGGILKDQKTSWAHVRDYAYAGLAGYVSGSF